MAYSAGSALSASFSKARLSITAALYAARSRQAEMPLPPLKHPQVPKASFPGRPDPASQDFLSHTQPPLGKGLDLLHHLI